jgi:hypothetical protein
MFLSSENQPGYSGKAAGLGCFYPADELFYFLAVVAESEQGFTIDDLLEVKASQGFIQ